MTEEICFAPASELAEKIKHRELSPIEVVAAFLDRIESRNHLINAYVTLLADEAQQRAARAEKAVVDGAALGPLHGVPVAIKDLSDYKAGIRNTFGSRPLADYVPDKTAIYVERLESAGAIVLGKTNTPEFGIKGTTDNLLFGPTSTPFDLSKNAGGSSGGSAAAVADGLAAIAQGTDGGGSVRIPASFCGVYGIKATFGRIPVAARPDAFSWHTPFIDIGPIARTVEDAALGLSVMAGTYTRDPHTLPDDGTDYVGATRHSVEGLKIAYSPNFDVFPVEKEVDEVVAEAVQSFESAGARVSEVSLGLEKSQAELCEVWMRELAVRNAATAESFKNDGIVDLLGNYREDLTPEFAGMLEAGMAMGAVEYKMDDLVRTEVLDTLEDLFEQYDLLVTPTLAVPPFDNAEDGSTVGPSVVNGEEVDPLLGWCLTYLTNFTGHPSASVPAGFTKDGLPIGMQIVGRRFEDETVLAASAAFERVRPWRESYPPEQARDKHAKSKR